MRFLLHVEHACTVLSGSVMGALNTILGSASVYSARLWAPFLEPKVA